MSFPRILSKLRYHKAPIMYHTYTHANKYHSHVKRITACPANFATCSFNTGANITINIAQPFFQLFHAGTRAHAPGININTNFKADSREEKPLKFMTCPQSRRALRATTNSYSTLSINPVTKRRRHADAVAQRRLHVLSNIREREREREREKEREKQPRVASKETMQSAR
jgi:hypothetical protein